MSFKAYFIYKVGAIQHVSDPEATLKNIIECPRDGGELIMSFYLITPATVALEPIRFISKRLPKKILWGYQFIASSSFHGPQGRA